MGRKSSEQRFWEKVNKDGPIPEHKPELGNCWVWIGGLKWNGYGYAYNTSAHRYAYAITFGPIPKGLCVCHKCDNRACVRPDHLFLGTQKENLRDMLDKGRSPIVKLKEEDVRAIIQLSSTHTYKQIAEKFNISTSSVGEIMRGASWKKVTGGLHRRKKMGKLTPEDVVEIKRLRALRVKQKEVAARFKVTREMIRLIEIGKFHK
jgi:DNA-binding transcriptional regulator YiaG